MDETLRSAFSAFVASRPSLVPDLTLRLLYTATDGKEKEERLAVESGVLLAASPALSQLVLAATLHPQDLVLTTPTAFRAMLHFLSTDELLLEGVDSQVMLALARLCGLPSLEAKLGEETLKAFLPLVLRQQQNAYVEALTSALASPTPSTPLVVSPSFLSTSSASSSPRGAISPCKRTSPHRGTPFDNLGDVLVPSTDKEGWCRNKKYIEKTESGFMCTVCRKVYGRYNSVSYHVTIYHRNPPIRCDMAGCQFSTREARYIHFHKYYRHHVPLPENIDLGTRKCPFCRHVSKSPAMLEKHVTRHYTDGRLPENFASQLGLTREVNVKEEPRAASESESDVSPPTLSPTAFHCELCPYKGTSSASLAQHWQFKHSSDFFLSRPGQSSEEASSSSSLSPPFPCPPFH